MPRLVRKKALPSGKLLEFSRKIVIFSPAKKIRAHILLPKGKTCKQLLLNGTETDFTVESVGDSAYVNIDCNADRKMSFEVIF